MILSKNVTKFSLARHVWKEMLFTISIKMCIFFLFWPAEKGTHFKFQWNFTKKRGKLIFKHYFLLHLICYLAPQWFLWTTRNLCFRIYFYIAPKRSQKITIIFFTFVTGVKHTSCCLLRPWYPLHFTLYCTLHFTLYCTLYCTQYSSLSFTPQSIPKPKWLADMT